MIPSERWTLRPVSRRSSCGLLAALALAGMLGTSAAARQDSGRLRTVRGVVIDAKNEPIPSAIVYLKNTRSLAVRTYIASNEGHYRFSGLDPNVDYQIHAEHQDFTSTMHTISSYDSHREIVVALKVDRKKSGK